MVAQRLPSFRLGTVWRCISRLRLGLGAKLGNFPGARARTSQTPSLASLPRRGRGWRRQGSGEAASGSFPGLGGGGEEE